MLPGDVVWAGLGESAGREQLGSRPCVVISGQDHLDAATDLVVVLPCTSRDRGWINHIRLVGPTGLERPTFAMTEQPRTVSRARIVAASGRVSPECLRELAAWVHRWLV